MPFGLRNAAYVSWTRSYELPGPTGILCLYHHKSTPGMDPGFEIGGEGGLIHNTIATESQ